MRSLTAFACPMVLPTYARSHRSGSGSSGGRRISALALETGPASAMDALRAAAASALVTRLGTEEGCGWNRWTASVSGGRRRFDRSERWKAGEKRPVRGEGDGHRTRRLDARGVHGGDHLLLSGGTNRGADSLGDESRGGHAEGHRCERAFTRCRVPKQDKAWLATSSVSARVISNRFISNWGPYDRNSKYDQHTSKQ